MSVFVTLQAIAQWKIDAIDDGNPDAVYVGDHRVDAFFRDKHSFVLGKKGTGKTAFATKLQASFADNVFYVTFDEIYPTYLDIQRHQKNPEDEDTRIVALQLAACLAALARWARQTRRPMTLKRWQAILDRVQRPAFFPAAIATVASILIRSRRNSEGTEETEVRLDFSRFKFALNRAQLLRDYLARVMREIKRKKGDVFLFIDGVDDLEVFSHYPFPPHALGTLRAFIKGTFNWKRNVERPIHLIAMLRPEFLELAELPNIKPKVEDNSLRLEWNEQSLLSMLSHRIDVEVEAAMRSATSRSAYFRRVGTRELFGRSEAEHTQIVQRLLNYGFSRPRDLIRYTKFAADFALNTTGADPHQPLRIEYFNNVIDRQRQYLLDEMKAELAVTLPHYDRFIQLLSQLHAEDERIFLSRDGVESELSNLVHQHSIDIDARAALSRLYSAFALGYRGAGNSRLFIYNGGSAKLPDGNQLTLHDLFRDTPTERTLQFVTA